MATEAQGLGYPEWTTKADKRGLDPLGMQTTSVALYQQLVPGISNVTLRMRYYGLYAWLAQRYASEVGSTSVEDWCLYIRRAEALYALVAVQAGGERGVAGVDWATRTLGASEAEITFHTATDRREGEPQYLKQKFGAFGAAYGSQLIDIGVLELVSGHSVPVPVTAELFANRPEQRAAPGGRQVNRMDRWVRHRQFFHGGDHSGASISVAALNGSRTCCSRIHHLAEGRPVIDGL